MVATVSAIPRVAVIVPAYGVAHLLGEALASLQAQTMIEWEAVVIDDGALDDVAGAVAPFLTDPRIRFLATANHGVSAARNTAIAATRAPLIALLDGDDLLRPGYLATTVSLLETEPAARLVTVNARIFGAVARERRCFVARQGRDDGLRGSLADVLDRSFKVYIGTTYRREDFDHIGGFDPAMKHAEDFDLWVRLLTIGGEARFVNAVLGDYRVRANSASAQGQQMLQGNIRVYEKARALLAEDAPEQALVTRLIAETQASLAFEQAIDLVIDGNTRRGLEELRSADGQINGPVWGLSFKLWRIIPALARPMLKWRRRAHRRGNLPTTLSSLILRGGAWGPAARRPYL